MKERMRPFRLLDDDHHHGRVLLERVWQMVPPFGPGDFLTGDNRDLITFLEPNEPLLSVSNTSLLCLLFRHR